MFSPFERAVQSSQSAAEAKAAKRAASQQLAHLVMTPVGGRDSRERAVTSPYFERLSGDPGGTEPVVYFGPEGAATCREFLRAMRDTTGELRGAKPIVMKKRRSNRPVWSAPPKYPASPLADSILLRDVSSTVGYRIGSMGFDWDKPEVVLCGDGLLRMFRSPQTFHKSWGYGYGNLPAPRVTAPDAREFTIELDEPSWRKAQRTAPRLLTNEFGMKPFEFNWLSRPDGATALNNIMAEGSKAFPQEFLDSLSHTQPTGTPDLLAAVLANIYRNNTRA